MADAPQARHPELNEYRLDVPGLRRARFRTNTMEVLSRRRRAIHFREGGLDHIEIGLQLAADPAIQPNRKPTPSGYGWHLYIAGKPPPSRQALSAAVARDIARGIEEAHGAIAELSKSEMEMSLRRLDRLVSFLWKNASEGDHWAVFRIIQIEERRARLLGWDRAPVLETHALAPTDTGSGTATAQQPRYDLEYINAMYDSLVECGIVGREQADQILEPVRSLQPATQTDDNVVDAELVDDIPDTVLTAN